MKKIINKPENYVKEMLEGLYIAHSDLITYTADDLHCLVTANKKEGKVGIATGGGSGHLPLFLGYVGKGMLDGCSVGDVFQSPSAEQMLAVTKAIDSGAGVLYIYGNYNGDIFNFDMAAEMADFEENIKVMSVVAGDDVASAGPSAPGEKSTRRGVAGIFFVYKCAGAELEPADKITDEMLDKIIADLPYQAGDTVDILVNGLGATPLDEQYIVTRRVSQYLAEKNITVHRFYVGEYVTAIEMAGLSISVLKLDDELKELMEAPACTPFFMQ